MPLKLAFNTFGPLAAGAVLTIAAVAATPARAALELQLQSGNSVVTKISTGGNPLDVQQSPIGAFDFSGDIGVSGRSPSLDLSSVNTSSSSGGTLTIKLSENDLTSPLGVSNWLSQFSGNFVTGNDTVTLATYLDLNNTLLGTGTLLSSFTDTNSVFALSDYKAALSTRPFTLTEVLTITATGASTTSLDSSITAVPEPASLALFGSALFGVGMVRRRGKKSLP